MFLSCLCCCSLRMSGIIPSELLHMCIYSSSPNESLDPWTIRSCCGRCSPRLLLDLGKLRVVSVSAFFPWGIIIGHDVQAASSHDLPIFIPFMGYSSILPKSWMNEIYPIFDSPSISLDYPFIFIPYGSDFCRVFQAFGPGFIWGHDLLQRTHQPAWQAG